MLVQVLLICVLPATVFLKSVPVPSPLLQQAPHSIDFLKKFGYLAGSTGGALEALYTKESVENAIKEAQRFGGLEETGSLNDETIQLFASKRCGVPDVIRNSTYDSEKPIDDRDEPILSHHHHHHHHLNHRHHYHHDHSHLRKKRYILTGSGWNKRRLKYYINNWTSSLSQSDVVRELDNALSIWAKYGNLQFSRTSDPSEAEISFGFYRGQHGDNNPFDGRGNVLAHAFFPDPRNGRGLAGDVHFDDDEAWSVGRANDPFKETVDFSSVALHELGHSLGLQHSAARGSVMNPYYRGKKDLGDDDVRAMYDLYVDEPMDDYDDDASRHEEDRRQDEARRRYDEEKKQWEEKRKEVERRRLEEEERKRVETEREERRRFEEKRRREEEERRINDEKLQEERKYEMERRRKEEERKWLEEKREAERKQYEEDKRRKIEERRKLEEKVNEDRRRFDEEESKRQEEERRKIIENDERKRYEEEKRRKWSDGRSPGVPPKSSSYPVGTTYEGDFETLDSHKDHDPTHGVPPTQRPRQEEAKSSADDGCVGKFDTVAFLRGELFIVKGKMLWRLSRPGEVQDGYPVEVRRFFHLLPKEVMKIDAMYQRERDSSLVIFSGREYRVFDGYKVTEGRSIDDFGFTHDIDRVDAATSTRGQTLLFSGDRYWSLNDTVPLQGPLQRQPFKPISALRALPDQLDAALTYNDVTYFFKDDRFWYMDRDSSIPVPHSAPASDYWIAC